MTNKTQLGAVVLALATTFGFSAPASAAFITIDDRNVNSVTISAGDFEGGFFVNGDLLTTGLGNSGSVTLADGGFTISGSWIDEGGADDLRVDILFAFLTDIFVVISGIEFGTTTDGQMGTLSGSFGALIDFPYFDTGLATFDHKDPTTRFGGVPFLSVAFTPEIPVVVQVPEPGTLALLGVAGLAAALRRRA